LFASCSGGERRISGALPQKTPDRKFAETGSLSPSAQDVSVPAARPLSDILEEVESYTPPDGVDEKAFAMLRAELVGQLMENRFSNKSASAVAYSGKVTDAVLFATTDRIRWSYSNRGDYNLDGEVGIGDLTPIAANFGSDSNGVEGDYIYLRWLDDDGSGEVGIGDITAIALNFGTTISSYVVYASYSDDKPGGTILGELPAKSPVSEPRAMLDGYEFELTEYPNFVWIVPRNREGMLLAPSDPVAVKARPKIMGGNYLNKAGSPGDILEFSVDSTGTPPLVYEWHFGSGAAPFAADAANVSVELIERGVFGGYIEVSNKYGIDKEYFSYAVVSAPTSGPNSIWIDAVEVGVPGKVDFIVCANEFDGGIPAYEIILEYSGSISASGMQQAHSYVSDNEAVQTWLEIIEDKTTITQFRFFPESVQSNGLVFLGDFIINDFAIDGRQPDNLLAYSYERGMANPDRIPLRVVAAPFEWRSSGLPAAEPMTPRAPYHGGGELNALFDSAQNHVVLNWRASVRGDYNGDFIGTMADFMPLAWRLLESANDGNNDDIDSQIDGGRDGFVDISDVTPIALNYLSRVTGYYVFRDGEAIGAVSLEPYPERTHLIELWPTVTYTDWTAPVGEHTYVVYPYDRFSRTLGAPSQEAIVVVGG
jgi:hypothetical protein